MERIKIAFDAQLLFEKQKTGIGWNAKMMIDQLIQHPEISCTLNCFLMRDHAQVVRVTEEYQKKGCAVRQSRWMPARVYNHLERSFPFPYFFVFGKESEITQFFNYTVPFGVKGKCITTVHDMAFLAYPETVAKRTRIWLGRNLNKYCRRADIILTVSEFSRKEIHRYMQIPLKKIKVIYNGVDLEHYRPRSAKETGAVLHKYQIPGPYLLYLGTLEPRKNIETLIRAYKKLKDKKGTVPKLVLAGKKGWLYDSIFQNVAQLGLQDNVIFTGYVEEEDVPALLSGAEVFLFPSLYEGFGIPPLEAMACGTPVITSNTSSLPEVVGNAGIMVPPTDADLLAQKIKTILEDTELKKRLIVAGLDQAKKFTWEHAADQLIEIYRSI